MKRLKIVAISFFVVASNISAQPPVVQKKDTTDFTSKMELAKYVHATLRTCDTQKIRALLIGTLETNYLVKGSTSQLNNFGKQVVEKVVNAACKGQWKYADQYCENGKIVDKGNGSMNISSIFSNSSSNLGLAEGVKYRDGVAIKIYRVFTISINVKQDEKTTAYLNSISDRSKLCN